MNLDDLKYVCSHAGSGVLPILNHLHIYEGRAQAGNGRYTVDVPCDLPDCTVHADRLLAAWAACKAPPEVTTTDLNLMVKAGRLRARVPLADHASYPRATPDLKSAYTAPGVSALLRLLQPFVATDASRPWATSICLSGRFAYATNNVVMLRAPFPADIPHPVNVPVAVFDAVTAKGEPSALGWAENALTFYFEDTSWIKTLLIAGEWPTSTADKYADALQELPWEQVPDEMHDLLTTAVKLSDSRFPVVEMCGTSLRSVDGTFEAEEMILPEQGRLNARMSQLVFEYATAVRWHSPSPDVHAFKLREAIGVFGGTR